MTTIEEYMELISSVGFEDHRYFYTRSNGTEIMYGKGDFNWRIRMYGEEEWNYFYEEEAVDTFNRFKIDFHQVESELVQNLCSKALLYRKDLSKIEEVISPSIIDDVEEGWSKFGRDLGDIVNKITAKKKLEVLDGGE